MYDVGPWDCSTRGCGEGEFGMVAATKRQPKRVVWTSGLLARRSRAGADAGTRERGRGDLCEQVKWPPSRLIKACGGGRHTRWDGGNERGQMGRARGSRGPNHARESAEVIHCG